MTQNLFNRSLHLNNVALRYSKIIDDPLLLQVQSIIESKLFALNVIFKAKPQDILITGLPLSLSNAQHLGYIDEESVIFSGNYDLIISNLGLHYVNDLRSAISNYMKHLNPNGVFMATLFGENNLIEIKNQMIELECNINGGASPRFMPQIQVKDASRILASSGFINVVSDVEEIQVSYNRPRKFFSHLKRLGQTNALIGGRKYMGKALYNEIMALKNPIIAKYNLITVMGFKK